MITTISQSTVTTSMMLRHQSQFSTTSSRSLLSLRTNRFVYNPFVSPSFSSVVASTKYQHRPSKPSYTNRQHWRYWNESTRNPEYVAMEEEARKKAEFEEKDVVGKRLREIAATPGDTQTIWANLFIDGKLVDGTQITIPRYNANIDMIKHAMKERCSEILTGMSAITFQVLPTQYKRKKGLKKLTRKNRVLKSELLYDMALHGGESEDAGIIVKAFTRKMSDGIHHVYGENTALDRAIIYLKAIMQDYQEIPESNGMKFLPNVPDLECGSMKNVILRHGITERFWNRVIEVSEGSSSQSPLQDVGNGSASEAKTTIERHSVPQQELGEQQQDEEGQWDMLSKKRDDDNENEEELEDIDVSENRYRVCVVGSDGVGKTTTTAVFIRLLLQKGRSVVYNIRTADKSRWVYEFIPNKSGITYNPFGVKVRVIPEEKFTVSLMPTLVDDIKSYYIVDPGATLVSNCNPDDQVQCRVVLITSPDEQYWGGNKFTMLRGGKISGTFLYYPSWKLSDLLLSYSMMIPSTHENLTRGAIKERYHEVGGVPSHLLAHTYTYRDIISTQTDTIAMLTEQQLKFMMKNHWKCLSNASTVVGYARTSDDDLFDRSIAGPVSTKVFESICLAHTMFLRKQLQQHVMHVQFANMMLAVLCRNAMKGESFFTKTYHNAINDSNEPTVTTISLGGCDTIEICDTDVVSAAAETESVIFHSASSVTNLVDFGYRKGNVYNLFLCTVSKEHILNSNGFNKLMSTMRSTDSRLNYYYVVPSFHFGTFTFTTSTDPHDIDHRNISILYFNDLVEIDDSSAS